jgi:hypothetical protein
MRFLRQLESPGGVFQSLSGMFMTREVIFFPVVDSGSAVGMGCKFMELSGSLVRIIWHASSYLTPVRRVTADISRNCPILNTGQANGFFYNPENTQVRSVHGCRIICVSNRPLVRLFGGARERGSLYRFPAVCRWKADHPPASAVPPC